jgi:antitoxin component of MazEF toxin-antitoxin module
LLSETERARSFKFKEIIIIRKENSDFKEMIKMDKKKNRKIIKQGGSHLISLPREFVKEHKLKEGQTLMTKFNGLLIIFPSEEAYQKYTAKIRETIDQATVDMTD